MEDIEDRKPKASGQISDPHAVSSLQQTSVGSRSLVGSLQFSCCLSCLVTLSGFPQDPCQKCQILKNLKEIYSLGIFEPLL